jgi:hypothetical protein
VMLDGVVVLVHRSSTLTTPQVQFALPWWVSRTVGSHKRYEKAQALIQRSWNTLAQKGLRSQNFLAQQCYSVLQLIGKPFWFPIDWRTSIPLFSQCTWETLRMPSSHWFENHSVFKLLGERKDNMFPERSNTLTVLEATQHIDLLTFGAFKSQRICRGPPEGSLHCLPPHQLAELYRSQWRRGDKSRDLSCKVGAYGRLLCHPGCNWPKIGVWVRPELSFGGWWFCFPNPECHPVIGFRTGDKRFGSVLWT